MSDGLEVDVTAVINAGARMVRSAEVLRQQTIDLDRLEFCGAQAGRDYAAKGEALRDALGVVGVVFGEWAADAESVGRALEAAAARYSGTDTNFSANIGEVRW
ncbi:hypothetical protein [Rhodococcus marinonascens]|uniref:hypothetical protein n=1 Tax=Rhodococcus marinonascens TaxID=38311 RepID=UPI0009326282|nr:hypothetical protein [Rhodococcus marinonascens]